MHWPGVAAGMDRQAERRLWVMTLVRLAGFALVLVGMWLAATSDGAGGRLVGGVAVMAGGLGLFLGGPKLLLRRWREGP